MQLQEIRAVVSSVRKRRGDGTGGYYLPPNFAEELRAAYNNERVDWWRIANVCEELVRDLEDLEHETGYGHS